MNRMIAIFYSVFLLLSSQGAYPASLTKPTINEISKAPQEKAYESFLEERSLLKAKRALKLSIPGFFIGVLMSAVVFKGLVLVMPTDINPVLFLSSIVLGMQIPFYHYNEDFEDEITDARTCLRFLENGQKHELEQAVKHLEKIYQKDDLARRHLYCIERCMKDTTEVSKAIASVNWIGASAWIGCR